jgi:hypothetical protein
MKIMKDMKKNTLEILSLTESGTACLAKSPEDRYLAKKSL